MKIANTNDAFDTLLRRRDEKQREHELACLVLNEGECNRVMQYRAVARLYDELQALQASIDEELAAEQGRTG